MSKYMEASDEASKFAVWFFALALACASISLVGIIAGFTHETSAMLALVNFVQDPALLAAIGSSGASGIFYIFDRAVGKEGA